MGDSLMNILDVFYNNIVKEATEGRINSFFYYNIVFSTFLSEDNIKYDASIVQDNLIVPTLYIKDKEKFNELLLSYVDNCIKFYDDSNFPEEILSGEMYDDDLRISKEKTILALLFSNATIEDFNNPISFLQRRLSFFNNTEQREYDLGYSNLLECNLQVKICKDKINNETPYQFVVSCISENGEKYDLPKLKFGVCDNKAYIFAIQNDNNSKTTFSKKVKRNLYKVGEGFSNIYDNYDTYQQGNLNDITPSFLVVANIFVSYMNKLGINDLVVSSMLIERWNAKVISNDLKSKIGIKSYEEFSDEQIRIQSNLTEKFLRTFLRLVHHCDNLKIVSYPMEQDSNLHIFNDGNIKGNNSLLNSTASMMLKSEEIIDNKHFK